MAAVTQKAGGGQAVQEQSHENKFDSLVALHGVEEWSDIDQWLAQMRPKFDSGCTFHCRKKVVMSGQVYLDLCLSSVPRQVDGQTATWWQHGKEKDVYDVIIFDTRARHVKLNACISAILHLESAANVFNLGVEIRNSKKIFRHRLVGDHCFSMSDDECSLFSNVWGPSPAEKKEGESKSQSNPVINHVIYHSLPRRHCNCGIKGKEFKQCSRCKAVRYCSEECQKAHWKTVHNLFAIPTQLRKWFLATNNIKRFKPS